MSDILFSWFFNQVKDFALFWHKVETNRYENISYWSFLIQISKYSMLVFCLCGMYYVHV